LCFIVKGWREEGGGRREGRGREGKVEREEYQFKHHLFVVDKKFDGLHVLVIFSLHVQQKRCLKINFRGRGDTNRRNARYIKEIQKFFKQYESRGGPRNENAQKKVENY
jgi:hypothetical protein